MIKNIIIAVLILGFIGSIIFLNMPAVNDILDIKKNTKTAQVSLDEKVKFIETVKALTEKYKNNEGAIEKLEFVLPDDQSVPSLIVQFEALANNNGMILSDVMFAEEEETEENSSDHKTLKINLKLSGRYESFKNFLTATENNMRLIDVDSINFQAETESEDTTTSFDFSVTLKAYYQTN
jgi:Tfp pilus assembly protein PilO